MPSMRQGRLSGVHRQYLCEGLHRHAKSADTQAGQGGGSESPSRLASTPSSAASLYADDGSSGADSVSDSRSVPSPAAPLSPVLGAKSSMLRAGPDEPPSKHARYRDLQVEVGSPDVLRPSTERSANDCDRPVLSGVHRLYRSGAPGTGPKSAPPRSSAADGDRPLLSGVHRLYRSREPVSGPASAPRPVSAPMTSDSQCVTELSSMKPVCTMSEEEFAAALSEFDKLLASQQSVAGSTIDRMLQELYLPSPAVGAAGQLSSEHAGDCRDPARSAKPWLTTDQVRREMAGPAASPGSDVAAPHSPPSPSVSAEAVPATSSAPVAHKARVKLGTSQSRQRPQHHEPSLECQAESLEEHVPGRERALADSGNEQQLSEDMITAKAEERPIENASLPNEEARTLSLATPATPATPARQRLYVFLRALQEDSQAKGMQGMQGMQGSNSTHSPHSRVSGLSSLSPRAMTQIAQNVTRTAETQRDFWLRRARVFTDALAAGKA